MPPRKLNLPAQVRELEYSDDRKQVKNPKTGKWVKIDGDTGEALVALHKKYMMKHQPQKQQEQKGSVKTDGKAVSRRMSQQIVADISKSVHAVVQTAKISDLGEEYTNWRELGRGAFGVTYSVQTKTNTVVIKRLIKHGRLPEHTEELQKQFDIEAKVLKHVQKWCKQFLVCYVDALTTHKYHYIIMEFLGSFRVMENFIDDKSRPPLSPELAKTLIRNLLGALRTMHEASVAHRDIKPANIMMDSQTGQIKMIDFGLSLIKNGVGLNGGVGSPDYIDPAITLKTEAKEEPTFDDWLSADLWSMGLTIFELLTGVVYTQAFFNSHLDEIEAVAYGSERKIFDAAHPDLRVQDVLLARYLSERGKDGHSEISKEFFYNQLKQKKQFSIKDIDEFYRVFSALTNLEPDERHIPLKF